MESSQLLVGGGVIGVLIVVVTVVPKVWRPLRRFVAVVDALAGRPPRYPGDPEARPGIIQRLDRIEWHVGDGSPESLRDVVEGLRTDVAHLKQVVGDKHG